MKLDGQALIPVFAASMFATICISSVSVAHAGIWAWGCKGDSGGVQVLFNRDVLVVLKGRTTGLNLKQIVHGGEAISKDTNGRIFSPDEFNDGLDSKTLVFTANEAPAAKIAFAEMSSRQISKQTGIVAFRDETWTASRKVYSYSLAGETTRVVTMDCADYTLSTTGGRRAK